MGFFRKLFGGGAPSDEPVASEPEPEPVPRAVVILRRGMSVPKPDYIAQVVAAELSTLPDTVERFGLSQPSWFKSEEIADSMAGDVAATFAVKLALPSHWHRRRVVDGPDGAPVMVIELFLD